MHYIGSLSPRHYNCSVLVPLGGGKDSIVVWKNVQSLGPALLVYVGDGLEEYTCSLHLERIVQQMGCERLVVGHEFTCKEFQRRARLVSPLYDWLMG
ncbi:hypothetical protein EON63_09725 [archaeon]|nr:MAG: hypothetical protein EON63_09725 [archaeon]